MLKVIESSDCYMFEKQVNELLANGYEVSSTNCSYDGNVCCPMYQAILLQNTILEIRSE